MTLDDYISVYIYVQWYSGPFSISCIVSFTDLSLFRCLSPLFLSLSPPLSFSTACYAHTFVFVYIRLLFATLHAGINTHMSIKEELKENMFSGLLKMAWHRICVLHVIQIILIKCFNIYCIHNILRANVMDCVCLRVCMCKMCDQILLLYPSSGRHWQNSTTKDKRRKTK